MTIVIAGGAGFIGTKLSRALLGAGHTVIVVDKISPRFTHERLFFIQCDLAVQMLPYNVLERTDAVINLVGTSINKKWSEGYKEKILSSRISATRTIVSAIEHAQSRPTVFISASLVGYYGDTGENETAEQSPKGDLFLSDVAESWEQAAKKAEEFGVRVVLVRTAPVLRNAGVLRAVTRTAVIGFLLRLVRKNYWMSWIHEEDIINIYLFALTTSTVVGPINATAPVPVLHREFVAILSRTLHRAVLGSLPVWITSYLFGDLVREITTNRRVIPQRLIDKGFIFMYPNVSEAFENIYKRPTEHKKKK